MENRLVTESWKERHFEIKLADLFFSASNMLAKASVNPVLMNLRQAFAKIQEFSRASPYSKPYLDKFDKNVSPVLDDLNKILFGNLDNPDIVMLCHKYDVSIKHGKYGNNSVENAQNILDELHQVLFLVKQWGNEQGIYFTKPSDRKYGSEAISEVMNM
jgi:hypothetical protein